jgi:hypothetical protein
MGCVVWCMSLLLLQDKETPTPNHPGLKVG